MAALLAQDVPNYRGVFVGLERNTDLQEEEGENKANVQVRHWGLALL